MISEIAGSYSVTFFLLGTNRLPSYSLLLPAKPALTNHSKAGDSQRLKSESGKGGGRPPYWASQTEQVGKSGWSGQGCMAGGLSQSVWLCNAHQSEMSKKPYVTDEPLHHGSAQADVMPGRPDEMNDPQATALEEEIVTYTSLVMKTSPSSSLGNKGLGMALGTTLRQNVSQSHQILMGET